MQRVYGITFPEPALMKDYRHRMEEAKKRDHRALGTQQELFFFDRLSPGSCFFQPAGARIYNALQDVRRRPLLPCHKPIPCYLSPPTSGVLKHAQVAAGPPRSVSALIHNVSLRAMRSAPLMST